MPTEKSEKRGAGAPDFSEVAQFCKESYLDGLGVALKGQEEAERVFKEAVVQGCAIPREWTKLSREWLNAWDEIGGISTGAPNPVLSFSKQCVSAIYGGTEPLLRASEEAFSAGFSCYEKIVAKPVREYTRGLNKKCMETVSP